VSSFYWPSQGSGGGGSGNVTGPASSTTDAIAIYADTTGKVLLNTSLLFNDGNLNPPDDTTADANQALSINFSAANKTGGTGDGGDMVVSGGNSLGGNGGDLDLFSGEASGSGNGGDVNVTAGNSASGNGGNINLSANTGGSSNGVINFSTANTLWATLDAGGNLTGPLTSLAVSSLIMTNTATPASGVGTLTNLPSGNSGNPTGYLVIIVNGTPRNFPFW
jgi:hypothetical protein